MTSPHQSRLFTRLASAGAGLLVAAALTFAPSDAMAQAEPNPVDPTGKGIAGGILLGAEIVMIPIAIAGVEDAWPYIVFGVVGAGGGAVGGAAAEGHFGGDPPAEVSLYLLAGGLALVIPTLVAVLNATAYNPEDEIEEGESEGDDGPDAEGEGGVKIEADTGSRRMMPMGLIGVDAHSQRTRVSVGFPALEVRPMYSAREIKTYGVEQDNELLVPVVRGAF